jgi:hypothetical protein
VIPYPIDQPHPHNIIASSIIILLLEAGILKWRMRTLLTHLVIGYYIKAG